SLQYGIVLDAGSSRTTVYVYQWPAEKENNTGVVSQTFKCSVKGSGISSYEDNPQEAPKAFDDCMLRVKEQVPENLHGSTRIYLGATAGMRLLRLQNETAAHEVLESIQSYFESQPFDFRGAQIISGQEEGVYGWITANYIMGNFLEKNLWHMWVHPHGVDTTGALDLGGASTQISFVSGEKMEPNASDTVQVSLYGYTYTLYTHSFQCYGRNEAEKKFLAMLLQTNISNPCYPRGYSTSFDLGHVFGSLCTEKQRPDSYNPYDTVTFRGTGDPWLCREKVASVFDFKACQEQDACSFDGIYQPKVQGPFVVRPRARWQVGGGVLHPQGTAPPPSLFLSLSCCLYPPSPILGELTASVLLTGICRVLLHSQRTKPLRKLLPYVLQQEQLGLLQTRLDRGQYSKREGE
ncbi:Ectonucleoside triphosphate diphosphohydrolase 3, partial [Lemmus lemmus]